MAEYHVGYGLAGIYAGTLEPKNKNRWRNKSDVTKEALDAAALYLLDNKMHLSFGCDGKRYQMIVIEVC